MLKLQKIKDPLYGYIYVSELEREFLSHPLVLRLHNVRQNGAAYLTYPSIRVHRYEHSIGAMHVAGTITNNSIKYSALPDDIIDALGNIFAFVNNQTKISDLLQAIEKSSNGRSNDLDKLKNDSLYHEYGLPKAFEDRNQFIQLIAIQAVRIAMLVHDIGHPPFSHTFETGLKQIGHAEYFDHERVGIDLLAIIIDDIKDSQSNSVYSFAMCIQKIVTAIVDKNHKYHKPLAGLASIVSSDIDADRLDYVRRDASASGAQAGSYDLGRIWDSIKLSLGTDIKIDGHVLKSVSVEYHATALSTFEAFFSVRFHLYRWVLWHHSVVMQNIILMNITSELASIKDANLGLASEIATSILDHAIDIKQRADYWYFTDSYFLYKLTELYNFIFSNTGTSGDKLVNRIFNERPGLVMSLEVFLKRNKDLMKPFWKTPADYADFALKVAPSTRDSSKNLNEKLKRAYKNISEAVSKDVETGVLNPAADNSDYKARKLCEEIEKSVNKSLNESRPNRKVRVRAYYLAKFRPGPTDLVLHSNGKTYPIETLSPTIRGLEIAWASQPHLWLFLDRFSGIKHVKPNSPPSCISDDLVPSDVAETVATALASYLNQKGTL
jgi:uncharacterized protein